MVTPTAGQYTLDPARTSIAFTTRHMFGLGKVKGTFALREGVITVGESITQSRVEATVDAASFTTDQVKRDVHVRSRTFLDTDNHPVIGFTSTSVRSAAGRWVVAGVLTVQGVRAEVELNVDEITSSSGEVTVTGSTVIDRYAHGITAAKGMAGRYLTMTFSAIARPAGAVPATIGASAGTVRS